VQKVTFQQLFEHTSNYLIYHRIEQIPMQLESQLFTYCFRLIIQSIWDVEAMRLRW